MRTAPSSCLPPMACVCDVPRREAKALSIVDKQRLLLSKCQESFMRIKKSFQQNEHQKE